MVTIADEPNYYFSVLLKNRTNPFQLTKNEDTQYFWRRVKFNQKVPYFLQLWFYYIISVFRIWIRMDPHKDMPPGSPSGSAWTDPDPDPGGYKA